MFDLSATQRTRLLIYLLFFTSGASGLVYEVVWVRQFGLLFGSTVYSASLVTALYMCGLGVGGFLAGRWADRHFHARPGVLVRTYGLFEIGIAVLAVAILAILPHLAELAADASRYVEAENGWLRLAAGGSLVRYGCAVVLLTPVTLLMGGTLTLLIRHIVGTDLAQAGWRVGALYGVNTAGAALGCLLTDTLLVPSLGLRDTQLLAVGGNLFAAAGALLLARASRGPAPALDTAADAAPPPGLDPRVVWAGLAIALSGFAAMAMQIVWFRHLLSLFGAYRVVFSILLTIILVGIWLGSLLGGGLARRTGRPGAIYATALVGFIVWALAALFFVERDPANRAQLIDAPVGDALTFYAYLLRNAAWVVGPPALLSGTAFPLANALIQRVQDQVGTRAGILYLANTVGGVLGSLLAGFVLLPALGIQGTAAVVLGVTVLAIAAVAAAARDLEPHAGWTYGLGFAACAAALVGWVALPGQTLLMNTMPNEIRQEKEQILSVREGVNETIAVTSIPNSYMRLITNGHSMSGTMYMAQRYMRAFAHVPMFLSDDIENVMIMCYGVGNTANAILRYPTVRKVDVVDVSDDVLEYASFFAPVNGEPLADPRVRVHVNDARHHLRMIGGERYDLITGEPPPISHAGVSNLYSREFFELAREGLRPGGFITYWLPLYQVGEEVTRAVVAAFLEVFPDSVLLTGYRQELVLLGRKDGPLEFDPVEMRRRLEAIPGLRHDLRWIAMDHPIEIVGMLAATAATMEKATQGHDVLVDDHPILEYGSREFRDDRQLPADLFSLEDWQDWCPTCLSGGLPPDEVAELEGYLHVTGLYYASPAFLELSSQLNRYVRQKLPPTAQVAVTQSLYARELVGRLPGGYVGASQLRQHGRIQGAINSLRAVLKEQPRNTTTMADLAELYIAAGQLQPARSLLERAHRMTPKNRRVREAREWLAEVGGGEPGGLPAPDSEPG